MTWQIFWLSMLNGNPKDQHTLVRHSHMIDQILGDLRLNDNSTKTRSTPAASSKLLARHSNPPNFDGKLNLESTTPGSNISYLIHQCDRFVSDPKRQHGDASRWRGGWYLEGTRDKDTTMKQISKKERSREFCQYKLLRRRGLHSCYQSQWHSHVATWVNTPDVMFSRSHSFRQKLPCPQKNVNTLDSGCSQGNYSL